MEKSKPIQEFKRGKIKAAIWANASERGVFHSVKLSRLYKVGEEWKTTERFGKDDLPVLRTVLDQAYEWMLEQSEARTKARRLSARSPGTHRRAAND